MQATADAVAAAAAELAKLDDAAGEAKAHSVRAQALARLGKVGACEAALDQALAAARKAGDRRRANAVLAGAPVAALWGPSPVTRASGRCLDVVRVLRITQGAPAVEAVALSCQGVLEALRGRTDAARRMLASSRKMIEDLGIAQRLYEVDFFAGRIELLEGDAAGAEHLLRGAYEGLRDLGLGIDAARAGALLARALLALGRADEAEALSHESERLAGDDLQAAIAWRGVRAEALAQRGDHAAAVGLAQAAVAIASATDALLDHADARLALAAALRAAGRGGEAEAEKRRAAELWEAKGATLLAERVQRAETPGERMPGVSAPRADSMGAAQRRVRRHPRINTAERHGARLAAAMSACDIATAERELADAVEIVHHPTGLTYDRAGLLDTLERLVRSKDLILRREALAALGDSLALSRQFVAFDASDSQLGPVGAVELESIMLEEIDATGRRSRTEIFAADHLGDAIARLYARYAELLPAGPEHERAAVTARVLAYTLTDATTPDESLLFDPHYADIDHRNVGYGTLSTEEAQNLIVSQRALADELRFRVEDVLALRPDGLVRKTTTSGVWRDGGGAFERTVCMLSVFGADGRATRQETFDSDREAEALARFDELTTDDEPRQPARRRVRANAASAMQARFDAALAARDFDGVAAVFHEDHQEIDHPTGSSYGREAAIASLRRLFRSHDPHYQVEPLATLGERLLLVRRRSGAAATASTRYDVGAYENEAIQLFEVDAGGLCRRAEVFAANQLGNAIARLYERYAELVPEGPARARAEGIARSVAAWNRPIDLDYLATVYAPTTRVVDHRFLATWSARDAEEILGHFRLQLDLASDFAARYDDVFAVAADALVVRITFFGTARDSDGPFENKLCAVLTFGADGRITESDVFEAEQEVAALARFDELFGIADARLPTRRPVRANTATHGLERFESALRARDVAALKDVLHESLQVVHHSTRATYGRREMVGAWRSVIKAERFEFRSQILASLGGALALEHHFLALEGLSQDDVPEMGRAEFDEIALIDADDGGRWLHCEIFAADRLGSAIVRLYELWAESLPEGPARTRAHGVAGALAAYWTLDADRIASVHVPAFECVDHRDLATWSAKGRDEWHRHWRAQAELATSRMLRDDDVLALEPAAIVRRQSFRGTIVATGGAYENKVISVATFDADGLFTRTELFEPDQEAQALACLDALVAGTGPKRPARRPVGPNAATRQAEREWSAIVARDETALLALHSGTVEVLHHPSGATYGAPEVLSLFRGLWRGKNIRMAQEILAALGDSLALLRRSFTHDGIDAKLGSFGPVEADYFIVLEVDERQQAVRSEVFAGDRLGDAVERLYTRYAESLPDGPARARATATARALTTLGGSVDPDAWAAAMAPDIEQVDHRTLSTWTARGRAAVLEHLRSLQALARDNSVNLHDVLAASPAVLLHRGTHVGTDLRSGGRYERVYLALNAFGTDGLAERIEFFDADGETDALARFDALTAAPPAPFANAATGFNDRIVRAWVARDWEAVAALHSSAVHMNDRRRLMRMRVGADESMAQLRVLFEVPGSRFVITPLATRGERLALSRLLFEGHVEEGGGSLAIDYLAVDEVDAAGRSLDVVLFDPADIDAAYAELDARFDAGEGSEHHRWSDWARTIAAIRDQRDPFVAGAPLFAPEFVAHDHRLVGWGTLQGAQAFLETLHALAEMAPDVRYRRDHLRTSPYGSISEGAWVGTHDGGAFESVSLSVVELDTHGRAVRLDLYDLHHIDEARARFDAVGSGERGDRSSEGPQRTAPLAAIGQPNAAHATMARWQATYDAAFDSGDWEPMRALCAPGFTFDDRRRLALLCGDRELLIASARERVRVGARPQRRVLGTAGDRVAMERMLWSGGPRDGRFEIEYIGIAEVGESELLAGMALFDLDDAGAARREAWRRWAAIDPVAGVVTAAYGDLLDAANDRDLARYRARFADALVVEDHRHGVRIDGADAYAEQVALLWQHAPDSRIDGGWFWPAIAAYGAVTITSRSGALADEFLWLFTVEQARIARIEVFALDAADTAIARLAQLRPGAARHPTDQEDRA